MKILVTGGTGTVGSQVVRELVARGHDVSVLTRDPSKARSLPDRAQAVAGNLLEVSTVRRVFDGMEGVFLLNAVGQTETTEGLMALCGMRLANVPRIVYLSVHHVDGAPWLPHFGSKIGVEEGIRKSGIAYTILRPNNFYQNDYWYKDVMLQHGIYPQPLGDKGTSRVDVRDIAEAAAVAFSSSEHEGQTYELVGPDVHTGASTAKVWSDALGRTVVYAGNDLEAWEKQSLQFMPEPLVFDFKLMYDQFQKHGLLASKEAIERQTRLLGHAPRSFESFAREAAAAWQGTRA